MSAQVVIGLRVRVLPHRVGVRVPACCGARGPGAPLVGFCHRVCTSDLGRSAHSRRRQIRR